MSSSLGLPILRVAIRYEQDIVTVRQKARSIAEMLGFERLDQARISSAVSELARNVYQYAQGGSVEFIFQDAVPQTLFIRVSDQGPGIAAIRDILDGVYVSETGMGVGISGTRKMMDHFSIETGAEGTTVVFGKILERRSRLLTKGDLGVLARKLIDAQPGSAFEEIQNQNRDLLNALDEVRAAKEELAQLNGELAETNRGVVALYAELDEKAESLRRANELKTKFLSNMTHELRTPLSSVISLTRMLLGRLDGDLSAEQDKQVMYIQKAAEGLLELVNDLLDLAKVEAGKLSVQPATFLVEDLLAGLRGIFRPLLGQYEGVRLEIESPPQDIELQTDQAKLSQILRNLVSNALKYTERGEVRVRAHLDDRDRVHFECADTGIGIELVHRDFIFEDFSQVDSEMQRKQKGTGLGLPLSRRLTRLLGGELSVQSEPGKGSVFHFWVPREYAGETDATLIGDSLGTQSPGLAESGVGSKFRVLLIDDDEVSRYVLKNVLGQQVDAEYFEATNGEDGLELMKRWVPDLVVLDLIMPGMDGFEIIAKISRDPRLVNVPVIINTSREVNSEEKKFLEQRAVAVLSKDCENEGETMRRIQMGLARAGFDYKQKGSLNGP